MIRLSWPALVAALALTQTTASTRASEEDFRPWKRVTLVADGGSGAGGFGDVTVAAESSVGKGASLRSLTVQLTGKAIRVPLSVLKRLACPQLHTLQIHSAVGHDNRPWLYIVFELWRARRPHGVVLR